MATLGELAKLIRSKNAGPFNLTFDVMFEKEETYRKVIAAKILTKESFSQLYRVPVEDVVLVHHDAARAVKISIPRPTFSGDLDDSDMYAGQQFAPLVDIEVPGT